MKGQNRLSKKKTDDKLAAKNTTNTQTLKNQNAKKIKEQEKKDIQGAINTGRWLQEVFEACEHGEYKAWLKDEFDWSVSTAVNRRKLYHLTQHEAFKTTNFALLNTSQDVLYLVHDCTNEPNLEAATAIVKAAKKEWLSYDAAWKIYEQNQIVPETVLEPPTKPITEAEVTETNVLFGPPSPQQEQTYTNLIKKRKLYEGACTLPWAKYFEYRDQHPDECAALTNDDLAYVGQWTDAGPAPSSDDTVEAVGATDHEHPNADVCVYVKEASLGDVMLHMMTVTENEPEWSDVIGGQIGLARLHKIIVMLQAVYDKYTAQNKIQPDDDHADDTKPALVH